MGLLRCVGLPLGLPGMELSLLAGLRWSLAFIVSSLRFPMLLEVFLLWLPETLVLWLEKCLRLNWLVLHASQSRFPFWLGDAVWASFRRRLSWLWVWLLVSCLAMALKFGAFANLLIIIAFLNLRPVEGTLTSIPWWPARPRSWSCSWPWPLVGCIGRSSRIFICVPGVADDIRVQDSSLVLLRLHWLVGVLLLFFLQKVLVLPHRFWLMALRHRLSSNPFFFFELIESWIWSFKMLWLWLVLLCQPEFGFAFCLFEFVSLLVEVVEFLMQESNLVFAQRESFSVNQAFDRVQLIHNCKVWICSLVSYGSTVCPQELLVQSIMTSLLQFKVLNSTKNFEQIFDNVFRFTAILSWFGVDHKVLFVLSQHCTEFHSIVIDCFIIKEMKLFQNIHQIDLTFSRNIFLDDWAILFVKLFNGNCLIPFFVFFFNVLLNLFRFVHLWW